MFELTVSINSNKQKYIGELYKKLFDEVKRDNGILIKQNYRGRSYIAIAVNETKKEYYKSKILDAIIFLIIDQYKFEFYKQVLVAKKDSVLIEPFLKAITMFDLEIDRDVILNEIELTGEVVVDSFYFFKLQGLRNRWARTAEIINRNEILASEESMIEIIKYLTLMSENSLLLVEILFVKKFIKLKSFTYSKSFKRERDGEENFLSELVRLNPAKINVKLQSGNDETDEIFIALNDIFSDRIYLL